MLSAEPPRPSQNEINENLLDKNLTDVLKNLTHEERENYQVFLDIAKTFSLSRASFAKVNDYMGPNLRRVFALFSELTDYGWEDIGIIINSKMQNIASVSETSRWFQRIYGYAFCDAEKKAQAYIRAKNIVKKENDADQDNERFKNGVSFGQESYARIISEIRARTLPTIIAEHVATFYKENHDVSVDSETQMIHSLCIKYKLSSIMLESILKKHCNNVLEKVAIVKSYTNFSTTEIIKIISGLTYLWNQHPKMDTFRQILMISPDINVEKIMDKIDKHTVDYEMTGVKYKIKKTLYNYQKRKLTNLVSADLVSKGIEFGD